MDQITIYNDIVDILFKSLIFLYYTKQTQIIDSMSELKYTERITHSCWYNTWIITIRTCGGYDPWYP